MLKRWLKRVGVLIAVIAALIIGLLLFLHTGTGKSIVRNKVQAYLQQKWKTQVFIGNIDYRLPNWIALKQVVILDHKKDTLISGGSLYVGIRLLQLLSNSVDITRITLENINLTCRREAPDSVFNFQFILDAFASSGDKERTRAKGTPMRLAVTKLQLSKVRLNYRDERQQVYFSASITDLSCLPDSLFPDRNVYHFNEFALSGSQVILVDSSTDKKLQPRDAKNRSDPFPLQVALNEMKLHQVYFSYRQPHHKTAYTFRIDSLQLSLASLDLGRQSLNAAGIHLSNSEINLVTWLPERNGRKKIKQPQQIANGNKWAFSADIIRLRHNSFAYHNAALPAAKGLDYQHVNTKNINLQIRKAKFDASGFSSQVDMLSLLFNDQLHIKQVTAGVRFSDSILQVQNMAAATNGSQLTTHGELVYMLIPGAHLAGTPQLVIKNSFLCYGDLLLIAPGLKKQLPVSLAPTEKINVSGNFSGTFQNLRGKQISLSTSGKQFQLLGNADFAMQSVGPEIRASIFQLKIKKQLLSKALQEVLSKNKIQLPGEINVTGKLQVGAERVITDLVLNSAFGQLLINGNINHPGDRKQASFDVTVEVRDLEAGKLTGLDSVLGKITGQIFIKGNGIQSNSLTATTRLQLTSAEINGYRYSNLNINAGMDRSEFAVMSNIQDPNLETELELTGSIKSGISALATLRVGRADLFKLGFTSDSLLYSGTIHVDANYKQPHSINATVRADSNLLFIHGKQIAANNLLVTCNTEADRISITATAPFVDAQLAANYPVRYLESEMTSFWRKLYPFQGIASGKKITRDSSAHRTQVDLTFRQDSLLSAFFPKLKLAQPLTVTAQYTSGREDSLLNIQVTVPQVRYKKYEARDWQISAKAVDSAMQFSLTGKELWNASNRLTNLEVAGAIENGFLLARARINDSVGKEYYSAGVELKKEKDETVIRLLDDVTFNHGRWKVPSDNLVRIVKEGYFIHNLLLESKGQTISVSTKDQQLLSPIDIRIDNIDIGNIISLLSQGDSLLGNGILNADISIKQPIGKVPVITGNIQASNLAVLDVPLGDMRFHSSSVGDSLAFEGGLAGENELGFNGHLHLSNGSIHLQSRLEKLNPDIVRRLARDFLSQFSGKITGELELSGSLDTLQYNGAIYADSVAFAIKDLNTVYRINKQKLVIDYPGLRFKQFTLSDSAGHPLIIDGKVGLFSAGEKPLDLNIETKNFSVLNASRKPGGPIFGNAIIDAKVEIKGSVDAPFVEGKVYLHHNSDLHLLPTTTRNTTKTRKDGILFVNIDTVNSIKDEMLQPLKDSSAVRAVVKGLKYNLDLQVDKDAAISVIIDPSTGDELVLKGDARLNAGVGDNGSMGVEGVYNLQSGYYKMNNLLIRGKFMLVKGSSISFNGDPEMAEANVTTEYIIEASPKGLLHNKDDDNSAYTQRVPFAVIFMIKGPVSKPVLSFDIALKDSKGVLKSSVKSDVEHALDRVRSDLSEMNKQVFSLLLTKRFSSTSGESSLESSNLNANNALKEGLSSFLAEAMNQVADDLIKGVDIDVNMKTYKTEDDPTSKTDLGVAMSKGMFEDRLVIRIEESFAVGETSAPAKSGSQYIPDITSTYKLSKDGRFQLKAYQRNEYDAVVQGYFTEVGINFTIEMSYDKFKEMVRRRKRMSNEK